MSSQSLDDYLKRVLIDSYQLLRYQCRDLYFPWSSEEVFIEEWTQAFNTHDSVCNMRLSVCLAGCPQLLDNAFETILSFARLPRNPGCIYSRFLAIKSDITLGYSGQLATSGLSVNSEERDLGESMRPNGRQPTEPADDGMWQELLLGMSAPGLPVGYIEDNEPSTTIASQSSEQHAGATAVDPASFSVQNLEAATPSETESVQRSPLLLLTRVSKSKKKASHPKKEYFRCQHIRALKKSIRQLKDGKIPGTSIHKVDRSNHLHLSKWNQLRDFYHANRRFLDAISDTAAGPATDGKKKREADESKAAKSYNNEYCKNFFGNDIVKRYNELFSALVYDCKPEEMCKKMKALCCSSAVHTNDCFSTWVQVHDYARKGMLQEIGLDVDVEMGGEEPRPEDFLSEPRR